jgi:dTDP-4-amino-4,6-dideoxygalactose transaminase
MRSGRLTTGPNEAVRYLGADPLLVDVDPVTLCIDFADAERRVTDRTVAAAPVHYAGLAVPDAALTDFAARRGLKVVEDAAHAFPTLNEGAVSEGDGERVQGGLPSGGPACLTGALGVY